LDEERAGRYRSIVGTLNYYSCALRYYDISYPVSKLSQYSNKPTVSADKALDTVLSYLSNTTDFAITCESTDVDDVACYSDSDHAGDREIDARSQSSVMILLNNAPVFWKSTKQPVTSLSSACAEMYALLNLLSKCDYSNGVQKNMVLPCHGLLLCRLITIKQRASLRGLVFIQTARDI